MFAMIATFTAFSILPVAEATVIFFVNPVLVALLAWLVLGEKVGLIGGVSVLVCFGGVRFPPKFGPPVKVESASLNR
ncbi:protein of unknown function [Pseudodesulfovibrio profundus]|uniref:EamA domain-containing protein n=2 Tax=Pseudodesulfovibrio profundus TaxID=57320 RepID=A0A2C8F5Q9_9BACT|nr:protein of unknown function [Pseudodesulfovibrio profundus]